MLKYAGAMMLALAAMLPAAAQGPGDPAPGRLWPQLVKYLELTSQQTLELARIELEWQRFLATKARRAAQVEREIRQVTLAEVIDPLALGVRYAELEAICRESRDAERRVREQARKVLNAQQTARLASLEQAYRLLPVIAEADSAHLLDAPLPGLNLAAVNPALPRAYPGCRFAAGQTGSGNSAEDPVQ